MSLALPLPPDSHPPQDPPPYVSLVVTSRNDNHGLNIQQRMQAFVDGWFHQTAKFGLDSELIFVEWNPPADRPRLIDSLRWPENRGPCRLRLIEVPEELHNHFACADRLPLYQFIAKNVGIRRARAPFILTSNIDILFSDELMAFLAERKLEENVIYRNDRLDVPMDLPDLPIGDLIAWCKKNVIRINGRTWTLDLRDNELHSISATWLSTWVDFAKFFLTRSGKDLPNLMSSARLALALYADKHRDLALQTWQAAWGGYRERIGKLNREIVKQLRRIKGISGHTNACGDFELMDRRNWFDIQGYLEYEGYSMHIDSLLLLGVLASRRAREKVLPFPMAHYHIEHSAGSGFTPEAERKLFEGLARRGIPFLLWEEVEATVDHFLTIGKKAAFNDQNWGLGKFSLLETVLLEDSRGR